jgi:hypothetical protein
VQEREEGRGRGIKIGWTSKSERKGLRKKEMKVIMVQKRQRKEKKTMRD